MTKRMLIDAAHADETRVVLLEDDIIYDYDFVTSSKSQIKGNIYLAKITRVEPSLQAAFVEYGGGKQGFLPFSEIHPDYYQLPQTDRQKLLEEQIAEAEAEEAAEDEAFEREQAAREARGRHRGTEGDSDEDFTPDEDFQPEEPSARSESVLAYTEASVADSAVLASLPSVPPLEIPESFIPESEPLTEAMPLNAESFAVQSDILPEDTLADSADALNTEETSSEDSTASGTTAEDGDEPRSRGRNDRLHRRYRIQEVIKRNQIVLVQAIKEERGNKGASLTTYISLAGRAAVLMPNSPKGGGISRKITDRETRKRLKEVASEMRTHRGMSVIIRTAGIDRSKDEIRRDYEYLVTVWNEVRALTLASTAPALVYEEGNLIKRSLRDLYTSDVSEILVEGDEAYKESSNFMNLLMPNHINRVKHYTGAMPLYAYAGVEEQLAAMNEPQVRLPSGGYLVIHPTEALISIDVNSGRSTTERNVEETAIKTNLEAAYEVARQLRLRDLAGLVVVDFIDMGMSRHRKQVERAMKDALKPDRAKIQVGRISMFGLLELSRQRLRPSISESMGIMCPHCKGTGYIHSVETVGIQIIRTLEQQAASAEYTTLRVTTHPEAALYLLNEKRAAIQSLEQRYNVTVVVLMDASMITGNSRLVKVTLDGREIVHEPAAARRNNGAVRRRGRRGGRDGQGTSQSETATDAEFTDSSAEDSTEGATSEARAPREPREPRARRERGGRNRRNRDESRPPVEANAGEGASEAQATEGDAANTSDTNPDGTPRERNRRRGRRGGRNRRDRRPREDAAAGEGAPTQETTANEAHTESTENDAPRTPRTFTPRQDAAPRGETERFTGSYGSTPTPVAPVAAEPKASFVIPLSEAQTNPAAIASPIRSESTSDEGDKSKRKGWWSRVLES